MSKFIRNAICFGTIAGVTSMFAIANAQAYAARDNAFNVTRMPAANEGAQTHAKLQNHEPEASSCSLSRIQVPVNDGALMWKIVEDCNLD